MTDRLLNKKISLLVLLLALCFPAISQHGNPLQFLSDVSQSSKINPSFQNKTDKLVIGLPIISGLCFNWDANFKAKNLNLDSYISSFYNSQNEPGETFFSAEIPLFFLSLNKKSGTVSFSISEKLIGTANFDNEAINFFAQGLQPYSGNNKTIGPVSFTTQYYREIATSYSTELTNGIRVGIRPKLLFGRFFYDIDIKNVSIETSPTSEIMEITPEGTYSISGPIKVVVDDENNTEAIKPDIAPNDFFFRLKNMGAGIDLGLSYCPNKQTELALSVLDLGFIKLKHKTYDARFTKSLHYHKKFLYQSSDSLASDYDYLSPSESLEAFTDSLPHITSPNDPQKRIMEMLPVQINAMLRYKLHDNLQIGASNHFSHYKNQSENFLTGFVRTQLKQKYELVGTLSLYNFKRILPGLGASYTGNSAQYFVSTNNILELVQPSSAKNINLCLGVNFLFSTD